jgi:hypothetical protein
MFRTSNPEILVNQIGLDVVFSVSGGRMMIRETGLDLPVARGYRVEIDLAANDTYTVKRTYNKGVTRSIKGEMTDILFTELPLAVLRAADYTNKNWGN